MELHEGKTQEAQFPGGGRFRRVLYNEVVKAKRIIVIVGPTAGGKSELAVLLAEGLRAPDGAPGEVINADSMQVYRHLDAGTAKPEAELRARADHYLLDIVEPTERFTAADWLTQAEQLIAAMQARGQMPMVVGGTNLYLKALLEGMFAGPAIDLELRATLAALPNEELHRRLLRADPAAAQRIHHNDRKRMIRALEVFTQTGQPISTHQQQWRAWGTENRNAKTTEDAVTPAIPETLNPQPHTPSSPYQHNPILIGLDWPTEAINQRINARVKAMFYPAACGLASESLPDEVRRLEAAGKLGPQARLALGYQQVLEHLAGRCTLAEAFEQTKIQTRRFAKRQRTWLKRYLGVHWIPAADRTPAELLAAAMTAVNAVLAADEHR